MPTSGWRNAAQGHVVTVVWLKDAIDAKTGQPQADDKNPNLLAQPQGFIRIFAMEQDASGLTGGIYNADDGQTKAGWHRVAKEVEAKAALARCAARSLDQSQITASKQKIPLPSAAPRRRAGGSSPSAAPRRFLDRRDVGGGTVVHHALLKCRAQKFDRDELLSTPSLLRNPLLSAASTRTPAMTPSAPCRRRRTSAGNAPAAASGSTRWVAHLRGNDRAAFDNDLRLDAEEGRRPQHQIRELALLHGADVLRHPVRDAGLMVYLAMALDRACRFALSSFSLPRCFFILSAVCQVRMISPSRPMA
jgi:hypothetical protein